MILSIEKIRDRIKKGELSINPILNEEEQLQGAKVDLRLDNVFWRIKREQETHHDTRNQFDEILQKITVPYSGEKGRFILHPGEFALAQTFEYVDIPPDLLGQLGGRSSLARQGVIVHATASVIDPGFSGLIILELANFGSVPVIIYPRQRVATIAFQKVEGETDPYVGKFGGAGRPAPQETDRDLDILDISI